MPKYVTILGTSHDLQGRRRENPVSMTPHSRRQLSFCYPARTEEASGCGPTIAEKSAHEKLGPVITWMLTPCVRIANDMELAIRVGNLSQLTFFMLWTVICARNTTWSKRKPLAVPNRRDPCSFHLRIFAYLQHLSGCVTLDVSLRLKLNMSVQEQSLIGRLEITPIRILLADDSDVIRRVLFDFLQDEPLIEIVGEAKDFTELLEKALALKPRIVLRLAYAGRIQIQT
jgi:hypothetical protein